MFCILFMKKFLFAILNAPKKKEMNKTEEYAHFVDDHFMLNTLFFSGRGVVVYLRLNYWEEVININILMKEFRVFPCHFFFNSHHINS